MAIQSPITGNSVNNGRRTPFQGFDVTVYVQDQATGVLMPFGEFTGFQHVVRNASEPYLPLGNRTMNILDGEFQIGWVAEQGKINLEVMRHVFGFSVIGPVVRLGRSPRFQIVVEYNAPDLSEEGNVNNQFLYNDLYADAIGPTEGNAGLVRNALENLGAAGGAAVGAAVGGPLGAAVGAVAGRMLQQGAGAGAKDVRDGASRRVTSGRYVFGYCKIDAFTTGIMAGRTAVADRIEGLAETWYWKPFGADEKPAAGKIALGNVKQQNYFKGQSGISTLEVPSWAADSSGTAYV